jgi:glutaredoxin-related protein
LILSYSNYILSGEFAGGSNKTVKIYETGALQEAVEVAAAS